MMGPMTAMVESQPFKQVGQKLKSSQSLPALKAAFPIHLGPPMVMDFLKLQRGKF